MCVFCLLFVSVVCACVCVLLSVCFSCVFVAVPPGGGHKTCLWPPPLGLPRSTRRHPKERQWLSRDTTFGLQEAPRRRPGAPTWVWWRDTSNASLDAVQTLVNGPTPTLEQNSDAVKGFVNEDVVEQKFNSASMRKLSRSMVSTSFSPME